MATGSEAETIVWRGSPILRAGLYSLMVVAGGLFAMAAVGTGGVIAILGFAVIWAAFVALIWVRGLRRRLTLTAGVLEIRDYPTDATIKLRDIKSCRAVVGGMKIGCVDGRIKLAPHPSKSLIAYLARRRTNADAAAELIMARAEAARAEPGLQDIGAEWWPFA
jgi:hypothetical protein